VDRLLKDAMTMRRTQPGECPDAEKLAAWAEGTIYGADAEPIEAHVADCQRCQSVIAAFVATEPAPAMADTPAPSHVVPFPQRSPAVRWVPIAIGAAAASFLLWMAWPKSPAIAPPTTSMARTEPSPAPVRREPAPTPEIGPAPKTDLTAAKQIQSRTTPTTRTAEQVSKPVAATPAPAAVVPPAASAVPPPVAAAPLPADMVRTQPPTVSQNAGATLQTLTRADSNANTLSFIMKLPDGGVEFGPTDPVATVTLTPTRQGEAPRSPLRNIRWRVMLSGLVEKTMDGGATWSRIVLDPAIKITSGASPSTVVCWLVGKSGAVLRSTDGGQTFVKVTAPDPSDLIAITANDARTATVSTSDGRRLTTVDGGQTWK